MTSITNSEELDSARQIAVVNPLKNKLVKGQLAHALSIKLVSNIEVIGYAAAAKYDSVLIDLEHSAFGLETTNQLSCAALALGYDTFYTFTVGSATLIYQAYPYCAGTRQYLRLDLSGLRWRCTSHYRASCQ
jgi:2-keto-3-deoxy-L-rhamnonate aldolase RhmA